MTTKLPASFLPAKFQVLSGSALKLIAITLMLIDHAGLIILPQLQPFSVSAAWITAGIEFSGISAGPLFQFSVFC